MLLALLAMLLVLVPAPALAATPVYRSDAATSGDMERLVVTRLNQDRAGQGLVAYRPWGALTAIARDRADRMAAAHTLSHKVAGGDIGPLLTSRNLSWYGWGEIIGMSSYPWGPDAVNNIYGLWLNSPYHRPEMLSPDFNYIGVGVSQASDGTTWISVVFTESDDHTAPIARNGSLAASGTTISFSWTGSDPVLQTHTAGLRSFDVLYRVDGGAWRLLRNDTTARSLSLANRLPGHTYSFRVQAADRRGTLSAWTREVKVSIP